MKKVRFTVACMATYHSELIVEDGTDEEILEEIWDRLGEAPVNELEWLDDVEDPSEAVTLDDIYSIEDVDGDE